MSDRFPRIAALKTADAFAKHLEASGIGLEFDRELAAAGASPLAAPFEAGRVTSGQSLRHPADGRLGRHDGRPAERFDPAALAPLRPERREVDLGRRGRGRAPGRPRESESTAVDVVHRRRDWRAARTISWPRIADRFGETATAICSSVCNSRIRDDSRAGAPGIDRTRSWPTRIRCSIESFRPACTSSPMTSSTGWSTISSRPHGSRASWDSSSWTSSTVTAISVTSC